MRVEIMETLVITYSVIMFIWCCVGFVVGYIVDGELSYKAFLGFWTGLLWPLSLLILILIGISKLILYTMSRKWTCKRFLQVGRVYEKFFENIWFHKIVDVLSENEALSERKVWSWLCPHKTSICIMALQTRNIVRYEFEKFRRKYFWCEICLEECI